MIQLKTLEIQLDHLVETLLQAKRDGRPVQEINELIGRIKFVAILIEKRKQHLQRNLVLN